MSQSRAVAHNSLILFAGKLAALLFGAIALKLLTLGLGVDGVEDYGTVLGFLALVVSSADFGLTTMTARDLARDEAEGERTFGDAVALRLLIGPLLIPLAVAAAFLLYRKPDDGALRLGVAAAACVAPLQLVNLALSPVFQVRQKMIYVVLGDFAARAVQLAALTALLSTGRLGYYSALGIALLGMGVNLLVSLVAARRLIRLRLRFDPARFRALIEHALPLGIAGIVSTVYFRIDQLMLRGWYSGGDAGLYYLATRAYDYALFVPTSFITVAFPVLVGQLASRTGSKASRGLQRSFDFLLLAGVPIAVGGAVLAPQVIRFQATGEFQAATGPLRLLMVAAVFSYLASLFAYTLIALGRQGDALRVAALVLAVNVGLNLYAIPRWGMMGAATCMLVTEILSCAATGLLVRRHAEFVPDFGRVPPILIAAGVMGAALFWLAGQGLRLWALAPIGLALYGGLAFTLGAVDRELIADLKRRGVSAPPAPQ